MALMTTSGSIPFSFARASMVCCSGFGILEFHFQIGARDDADRHPVASAAVAVDQDVVAVDAAENSFHELLPVDRLTHHQLRAPADEAPIVVRVPKRAVETGR